MHASVRLLTPATPLLALILSATGALAQETNPTIDNDIAGGVTTTQLAPDVSLSYGVGLVTNYISKGLTQTDNDPAVQPYAELGYGIGYLGVWGSNASFGGVKDTEIDVSIGIRPEFNGVQLDMGFVQYFYVNDDADYGEAYLFAKYAVDDKTTVKAQYYHEVYANKDWLYLGASYAGLPLDLTLSGGVGSDFGTSGFDEDSTAVDIGVSGSIGSNASYDFRASDSSIEGARFIATLSFFN